VDGTSTNTHVVELTYIKLEDLPKDSKNKGKSSVRPLKWIKVNETHGNILQ